jgi:hypothetical protein
MRKEQMTWLGSSWEWASKYTLLQVQNALVLVEEEETGAAWHLQRLSSK